MIRRGSALLAVFAALVGLVLAHPSVGEANHSWGNYHWARTANPFTLQLGDKVNSAWDSYLAVASGDWNRPPSDLVTVLQTTVVAGNTSKRCQPTAGTDQICNDKYGFNGWLGLAQIWASGDHITQGTVKVNDSYFNTSTYNKPGWRQFVMCQEIGHTFGLDHQDENFDNANLGTCMDYTRDPDGTIKKQLSNLSPNRHDFEQLALIYGHLDSFTTVAAPLALPATRPGQANPPVDAAPDNPGEFGAPVGPKDGHGRDILFVRDLGNGHRLFTWVTWAEPGQPGAPGRNR